MTIPEFKDIKARNAWLVENKEILLVEKKSQLKKADSFSSIITSVGNGIVSKEIDSTGDLLVQPIINTTNILDSHKDVHIPKLWNKSIKENKSILHLQEHQYAFKNVIASAKNVKAYIKQFTFKELGYNYEGTTEALIFDSIVKQSRNPFMYNLYKEGEVNQHSVGMFYVKLLLAINDQDYKEEFAAYEKYFPMMANKEAETDGYFYAVLEAKAIEGSAVLMGSNHVTPTYSTEINDKSIIEPSNDTQQAAQALETKSVIDYMLDKY